MNFMKFPQYSHYYKEITMVFYQSFWQVNYEVFLKTYNVLYMQ